MIFGVVYSVMSGLCMSEIGQYIGKETVMVFGIYGMCCCKKVGVCFELNHEGFKFDFNFV